MRNLRLFGWGALSFIFLLGIFPAHAQPVGSGELIIRANDYDGQTVTYVGEVIGDIMLRGEYAWVNVNDGSNAIGLWLPKAAAIKIIRGGSYKSKGDWVEVSGVFRRACPQHGGDLDIHAEAVRMVVPGRPYSEQLNLNKRNMATALAACLCLIWILRRLKTA
jgi:hypothetical protein